MKLGLIGLGKMGLNLAANMQQQGIETVTFDLNAAIAVEDSITGVLSAQAAGLSALMIPDQPLDAGKKMIPDNVLRVASDLRALLELLGIEGNGDMTNNLV
jgi:6-phosphogluconate dehydrogenase (decarboxylating)